MHSSSALILILAQAAIALATAIQGWDNFDLGRVGAPISAQPHPLVLAAGLPLRTCGVVNVSWTGGEPPYLFVIGRDGWQDDKMPKAGYDGLSGPTWLEYTVDETEGTTLYFEVFDAQGASAGLHYLLVEEGDTSGCVGTVTLPDVQATSRPPAGAAATVAVPVTPTAESPSGSAGAYIQPIEPAPLTDATRLGRTKVQQVMRVARYGSP